MKNSIFLFLLVSILGSVSANHIISLPYLCSEIVYSPERNKLYALINEMDSEYGNHLVQINVNTGEVERALFVGSIPITLRLTDDENYVWISFKAIPFMKRVDLNAFVIDKKQYLGPEKEWYERGSRNSQILCYNFSILGGESNSLAMGLKTDFIFDYTGIYLYKNDTILPKRIRPFIDTYDMPQCIEPVHNNDYLIGHYQSSGDNVFSIINIVDDGLELMDEIADIFPVEQAVIRNYFQVHNDSLYIAEGYVVDATDINGLQTLGRCENDIIGDKYGFTFSEIHDAFVYPNITNDSLYLTFYNKSTFKPYDSVFLMEYDYFQVMMITHLEIINWNRFAITIGKDYGTFSIKIIGTHGTGTQENPYSDDFKLYPNPGKEKVTVTGTSEIRKAQAYSLTGQLIKSWLCNGNSTELDITDLSPGIYLLKIENDHSYSTAAVKKLIVQ